MKRKVLLAVLLATLMIMPMLLPANPALAAQGGTEAYGGSDTSGETLMRNSAKHYIQALIAYNEGDLGEARGQLQAAASNAKHVDPYLAGLLGDAIEQIVKVGRIEFKTAQPIADTYNAHNDGSYPMFDPGNPMATPPGEQPV